MTFSWIPRNRVILVTALIRELVNLQCSVIVLSATLTAAWRKELLKAANASEDAAAVESEQYPLVTAANPGGVAVSVAPEWTQHKRLALRAEFISEEETIEALISRAEASQHVLWVRNTVVEAQQSFRALLGQLRKGDLKLGLLHSRFPFQRRSELEQYWLERLGRQRPTSGPGSIIIATQVVEQSVDIDLDFIVSDLAPTDMLLQRMGRLWRHERPTRAATQPDFWIRVPELNPAGDHRALKKALGRSAWVYAPYVLLRSVTVFAGKTSLTLPDDIRPVLEATYEAPATQEPSGWQELHDELEAEKQLLTLNAEAAMRVLANPALADEEGVLTRRKGPPTIPVLLLRSVVTASAGTWQLTALDGSGWTVSDYEWRMPSARFLHHWLVRVPKWMVPGGAPRPPWLTLHTSGGAAAATVQDDGRLCFGETVSESSYNETFGVFAERPAKTTPQCDDDDEFDS
jgi:CRISPR-associated endonuclease/helicase Cas3